MEGDSERVVICTATPADIEGLVASGVGLFAQDAAVNDRLRNPGWPRMHAADQHTRNLADPDVLVLVARSEADGAVVGHLSGGFHAPSAMWLAPRAHLISLHVMAPWRGQNVGGRLVERFRAWAVDKGAVQLRVTAYTANEGAIRFYRRHGFVPLESTFAADLQAADL